MNIYLDVDRVLLTREGTLANHCEEFLEFFTTHYTVYWFTVHCRNGENNVIEHIMRKNEVSKNMRDVLQKVQPTTWQDIRTEAIDFSQDFVLFTDVVTFEEKTVLLEENAFFRLHEIDLQKDPDQLAAMSTLGYTRMLNRWQNINLDLSFGEAEFTLIQKGFESDQGMDERWRFEFHDDTLYIMRHWTGWINYKLRFRWEKGVWRSTAVYLAQDPDVEKEIREATFEEKNFHGVLIVWLIEKYLFGNKRDFLVDSSWYQTKLKIAIDSIHGYDHWRGVEERGHYIAKRNGADKKVVSAFAFTHDIGRTVDSKEPGHGQWGADIIREFFVAEVFDLNTRQYEQLLQAVAEHDIETAQSSDITVQTCWDADRLDLPRIYVLPDKNRLCTEVGKSEETFRHFHIGKK